MNDEEMARIDNDITRATVELDEKVILYRRALRQALEENTKLREALRKCGRHVSVRVIAEIGINHNGDFATALKLVEKAAFAEAWAVKFQVRTPRLCVPEEQWNEPKLTPWGETMPYIEYRERMEFSTEDLTHINEFCAKLGITWSASVWDSEALERLAPFKLPWIKIPSAKITDGDLINEARQWAPLILSTGMSTWKQVLQAVAWAAPNIECVMHCHSAYPAAEREANLRLIDKLKGLGYPVGYSGHEYGLDPSIAAVHYGAQYIERHLTLDKHMPGSDHASSLEPDTFYKLVKKIRSAQEQIGDGEKRVWPSELPAQRKLRGSDSTTPPLPIQPPSSATSAGTGMASAG